MAGELNSPYDVLVPWCKLEAHAGQTDAERYAAVHAKTLTSVVMRFGSWRTIASVLTDAEYDAVETALTAAAQTSKRIAAMVAMLAIPGKEDGSGGGIDFGDAGVRALCDTLLTATAAAKLKAVAEVEVSQAEDWGVEVTMGHLASARQMIAEGA